MAYDSDIRRPGLGGMNNDMIDSELSMQDTRYVKNAVRFSGEDGLYGVVRNIKGNLQVASSSTSSFSANAKVIGVCRNESSDSLIVFVSDTSDAIYEYFPKTDTVEFILKDETGFSLNFSGKIKGAYVINGLLYWNDNNGLRKVNIQKAKNYLLNKAGGNYSPAYTLMDYQTISLIKYPYLDVIIPTYATDTTRNTNNLRGYLFQFRVQYIYDDNERSVASPISRIAVPKDETDITGEVIGDTSLNNVIKLNINSGHQTVEKIAIYVRIGNTGDWVLADTLSKKDLGIPDNSIFEYSFYNDNIVTGVDQVKINQLYHAVPLKSDYLGYLHTNQLIVCGNLDGYDNVKMDATLKPQLNIATSKVSLGSLIASFNVTEVSVVALGTETIPYLIVDFTNKLPAVNTVVSVTFNGGSNYFVVTADEAASALVFKADFVSFLMGACGLPAVEIIVDYTLTDYQIGIREPIPGAITFTAANYNKTAGSLNSITGYKAGTNQSLGVVYYDDAGRSTFVQPMGKVYLPFLTEPSAVFPSTMTAPYSNEVSYSIKWTIHNLPPQWATRWQIVRQANLTLTYFQQYIINGIADGTSTWDSDKTYIDISPLNKHRSQYNTSPIEFSFPSSNIGAYVFEKGDRIRFITQSRDYTTDPSGLGSVLTYYLDMEILGYQQTSATDTTNTDKIMVQKIDTTKYPNIGKYTLVEIYRPNKAKNDMLYYETGEMYKILPSATNPNVKIHSTVPAGFTSPVGVNQDVDINGNVTVDAAGESTSGDVYIIPIVFDMNLSSLIAPKIVSLIESSNASQFYVSDSYNIGRTQIVDKNIKQQKTLSIRISGKYFDNSFVNNLSEFYGGKDLYVSPSWGDTIYGAVEKGYTLNIFQSRKVTQFYVGRTGLQLASAVGTDQIMANSDATLSTQSPSPALRGTMNSESILTIENTLFYVDVLNGSIVQQAVNGIINLEVYGIRKDIKNICESLLNDYQDYAIYSSFDPVLRMIRFTFQGINGTTITDKGTYFFDYTNNKWSNVYFFGVAPVYFTAIDQYYISFLNGGIWKDHINSLYNNFYGVQLSSEVELVFNKNYGTPKLFKSLLIVGKGTWFAKNIGDVLIEAKNNVNGIQQRSRLLKGRFKNIRGKQTAYFLKNADTKGAGREIESLRTGDDLKGNILFLRLTCEDNTEAFIDTVIVNYQILKT